MLYWYKTTSSRGQKNAAIKFVISNIKIDDRKYNQLNIYSSSTEKEKVSALDKVTKML